MWSPYVHVQAHVLPEGVQHCGDAAFRACLDIACPLSDGEIAAASRSNRELRPLLKEYNVQHSSVGRIKSENAIGLLKNWAIIRGRRDVKLHQTNASFELHLNVIWGIVNMKQLKLL